jgi:hypothetical protein
VQFSAPYTHHMLGKIKCPWRTIWDNSLAMLHGMYVPNSMWPCAVRIIVYLRNSTFRRAVGPSGGVPLTLRVSPVPDASRFRVFGCIIFVKVLDQLCRKMGEKAFRGVVIGYPPDAPRSRVYNPITPRITTSVHVVFQEDTPGFSASTSIDSVISGASDKASDHDYSPQSHPHNTNDVDAISHRRDTNRSPRLQSHPVCVGDLVTHLPDYPPVRGTTCHDHEQGKAKDDSVEQPNVARLINDLIHHPLGTSDSTIALLSA